MGNTWGDLDSDTGYDVVAGALVADGRFPYIDFVYYYGPLAPLLAGLVSVVAGPGIGAIVALGFAITAADRRGHLRAGADVRRAARRLPRRRAHDRGRVLAEQLLLRPPAHDLGDARHAVPARAPALPAAARQLARRSVGGAAGTALGLLALTKPEPALAGAAAVVAWLVARAWSGRSVRRDAIALAGIGLAIPAVVYGAFLTSVSFHRLFFENLYPARHALGRRRRAHPRPDAADDRELRRDRRPCAPLRARRRRVCSRSRGSPSGRAVRATSPPASSSQAACSPSRRRSSIRRRCATDSSSSTAGCRSARPLPPSCCSSGLGALRAPDRRRSRRRGRRPRGRGRDRLQRLLPPRAAGRRWRSTTRRSSPIFLVHLHLKTSRRRRPLCALGALWLGFLVAAGVGLTLKDARAESAVVRGDNGSLAETPAEAALYRPRSTGSSGRRRRATGSSCCRS